MIYVRHSNEVKEVIGVYIGNIPITTIYNKSNILYQDSAQICFSNGYWVDEFPWDDNSYWMD